MSTPPESHTEFLIRTITDQYRNSRSKFRGRSFGEILCGEIHTNGLTFLWLAKKWGIPVTTLGELIADHCRCLEEVPVVNHKYRKPR